MDGVRDAQLGQAEFARLVDSSPDGLLVVTDSGVVRYANKTAHEMLGMPGGSLQDTEFGFPLGGDLDEAVDIRGADGAFHQVQMRVTPVLSDGQQSWVVALRQMARAQDVGAPGAFPDMVDAVAVTSHELRTPMTTLAGFLDVVASEWKDLSEHERLTYVTRAQSIAHRLHLVVSRFLNAVQLEAGLFTPTSGQATPLLDTVLEGLADFGDNAADLDLRVPAGVLVDVHATHLWSVVSNFLVNAFRHGSPPVTLACETAEEWVVVTVSDAGPGVPDAEAERLFERYARADAAGTAPGTGLGLWIARSIARAYGGDAWYEPAQPHGARFRSRLPLAAPSAAPRN
jgi:signal transduction histidine kinase